MSSKFIITASDNFIIAIKKLSKKYPSIKSDLLALEEVLLQNPTEGIPLGKDCYKLRLKISSKGKGKSAGARVITFVKIMKNKIILLDIFDKSERESITDKELKLLLKKIEE